MDSKTLEDQLNSEIKAKEEANQLFKNLEKKVYELKNEIINSKKQGPDHGGVESDGYKQYQHQLAISNQLERNVALEKERLKILHERNKNVAEMDLDVLSQTELIVLVKQLERMRTDLQSTLRGIQANVDQQAQEYRHLKEMKKLYNTEMDLRERKRRHGTTSTAGTAR